MREALARWVSDADTLQYIGGFELPSAANLTYIRERQGDYYVSLVGELFARLHSPYDEPLDWSRLGNALTQEALSAAPAPRRGAVLSNDVALFAAAAFYLGGFSASAYLTLRAADRRDWGDGQQAAFELLARPASIQSPAVERLIRAIRIGDLDEIEREVDRARNLESSALQQGPEEWVGWRLFTEMLIRFRATNVRAVLPSESDDFWDDLVGSLLERRPPVWDFFPSQIEAIASGLLTSSETFSLQMPTGAGKTALTETILFSHLKRDNTAVAIVLVPFRALASELRRSLVQHLNAMGFSSRALYGGTVPSGDEVRDIREARAVVATPEALQGVLSTEPDFLRRVSLVICDEGHLLDSQGRGVSLELLLTRMAGRASGPPKFVFVSAIVPNIEEINAWLGGTDETVVRSDYRPAIAEFAQFVPVGSGANLTVALRFHPHDAASRFDVNRFLTQSDFLWRNAATGRLNTYGFGSIKVQAVAAARKSLAMGAVAVFAANKRGDRGCVGLAEELLAQLELSLALPTPRRFVGDAGSFEAAMEYLTLEYGSDWVATRALDAGAVIHHGDIPQETREVFERLLVDGVVRLAFCTSTLAEGVNLPIRTLVLYSVQRQTPDGAAENLLSRDIKNLVGRAGRAGATTRGLVMCANPKQWRFIEPVARQRPGEEVKGALLELMERVTDLLKQQALPLTNEALEGAPELHQLIDGIDATLLDLAAVELGELELRSVATRVADQTYAARQADDETRAAMRRVFELRASRIFAIRQAGRLDWIRETGTRARMLSSVEQELLPARQRWDDITTPLDAGLLDALLAWAWRLPDVEAAVNEAYRDDPPALADFIRLIRLWLEGRSVVDLASAIGMEVDALLAVMTKVVSFELQTAVEQGIALLARFCAASGQSIAETVVAFPENLRYGVPTPAGRVIAAVVTHRRAAVALGLSRELITESADNRKSILNRALNLLKDNERWSPSLGQLVIDRTAGDLQRWWNNEVEPSES